jgi:sporulation protein YlmC with PRC-barrel domain
MKATILVATALLLAGTAFTPVASAADKSRTAGAKSNPAFKVTVHSANKFIGMEVVDRGGEKIGEIQDVLLDIDKGRIAYAVVSTGGVFGIGDANHIVPWKALSPRDEGGSLALNVGKDRLAEAPKREADMSDEEFHRELHRFYGIAPYWGE